MKQFAYQKEIDGLRAVAVLAVLIFHLFPDWLPSGFIGVDVFLVISGYLITSIILYKISTEQFSLNDFYKRRIKRILPITYITILLTLGLGYFLSSPIDFRSEANSAISALFYVSNFRFALMDNYFTNELNNPLIHLWSLSLEEQFYFLWPMILICWYKLSKKIHTLLIVLTTLLAISFGLAYYTNNQEHLRHFTYFILPTRMQGLLIGAILACILQTQLKNSLLFILSSLCLSGSFVFINKDSFPNINLMIPLLATCLMIVSSSSKAGEWVLGNKVSVYLGKLSFSIYMLHMPLLVFGVRLFEFNISFVLAYLMVTFALAVLSYEYFEKRVRFSKLTSVKTYSYYLVGPVACLAFINVFISVQNGVPQRFGLTQEMTMVSTLECNDFEMNCFIGDTRSNNNAILIGDSHAQALTHFFDDVGKAQGVRIKNHSVSYCKFFMENFNNNRCEKYKQSLHNELVSYREVFIVMRLDNFKDVHFESTYNFFKKPFFEDKNITFFLQLPKLSDALSSNEESIKRIINAQFVVHKNDIDFDYIIQNKVAIEKFDGIDALRFVDLSSKFIINGQHIFVDEQNQPLYFDDDHINAHGAEWLARRFIENGYMLQGNKS